MDDFPMVQIRLVGRPDDVDAATELLCRATAVSEVSRPVPARTGGVMRYVTAAVVDDEEVCHHGAAEVVSTRHIPGLTHVVEYGLCSCGARVVRVMDGDTGASGGWSAFTPVLSVGPATLAVAGS